MNTKQRSLTRLLFTLSLFFAVGITVSAQQEMVVKSFEAKPMDLSAATKPVDDANGQKCALIKVQCALPDLRFSGNVVGSPSLKNGEYWVYVSPGASQLDISSNNVSNSLHVGFQEYIGGTVSASTSYHLLIDIPKEMYNRMISLSARKAIIANIVSNMVPVKGGTFTMGATKEQGSDAQDNEKPAHDVTVASFKIGKYDVTQEQWETIMGDNPSKIKGQKKPVTDITWKDCQTFIKMLNSMTGLQFRLPTETEWEYAARGGNKSQGYKYSGGNAIDAVGWCYQYSGRTLHDVGELQPNELGIYDMSGNVYEWCQNLERDYKTGEESNMDQRVYRGGSYDRDANECRVSRRPGLWGRGYKSGRLGFRLALAFDAEWDGNVSEPDTQEISMDIVEELIADAALDNVKDDEAPSVHDLLTANTDNAIVDSIIHNMVYVGGGRYNMGIYNNPKSVKAFYIGKYEVTQDEWQAVMGTNPSQFKGSRQPVENVSWEDVQTFLTKLNAMSGLKFRLPSYVEWEYAARGGNKGHGYKYAGGDDLDAVGWYTANSGGTSHDVGTKLPNELGLYDMSGNVLEHCQDIYNDHPVYKAKKQAPVFVHYVSGGSWQDKNNVCQMGHPFAAGSNESAATLGFRLALSLKSSTEPYPSETGLDPAKYKPLTMRQLAERGDAIAQYQVGEDYFSGNGVIKDYVEAVKWYRKSAEQCYGYAEDMMARCYRAGWGVSIDEKEEIKWMVRAAKHGVENDQLFLGQKYYNGTDLVGKNYVKAAKWFRTAAENGSVMAQYLLGMCYKKGEGVPQDNAEAEKWLRLAAEHGYEKAKAELGIQ